MTKIDPRNGLRELAVDVWTGNHGPARPSSDTEPTPLDGDSPRIKTVLPGKSLVTGEALLPPLSAGNVYWLQPRWINAFNQTQWGEAIVWEVSSPPVERSPALLQVKHTTDIRAVSLTAKSTLRVSPSRKEVPFNYIFPNNKEVPFNASFRSNLTEATQPPDGTGDSQVHMRYKDYTMGIEIDGTTIRHRGIDIDEAAKVFPKLSATLVYDATGQVRSSSTDLSRVPSDMQESVKNFHPLAVDTLSAFALPMPNRITHPGETWHSSRKLPLFTGAPFETSTFDATCTYVGRRTRNSREEAVVTFTGPVKGEGAISGRVGGRVDGIAVFDIAAGWIVEVDARVSFDMDTVLFERPSRGYGVMDVKLVRVVKP